MGYSGQINKLHRNLYIMIKKRYRCLIAVYLILEKDNKILLHLRKNGYADGFYSLVAGHLDGNETIINAMKREAKEEIDIDIKPQDLKIVHMMHRIADKEYIDIYLSCKKWSREIKNCEPHKCGNLLFACKNNLPKNILQYVKIAIENISNEIFFSEIDR